MADPIVGIDLGTSNSVVAYADGGGTVRVLADDSELKVQPSVVSFHPNGGVIIGAAAKQRRVIDPQNTIYSVKRLIGRSFRSPEVQTARGRVPYQIKEGANQMPLVVTRGGEFAVPEISAIVLDHVRNIATARMGMPISRAVVTVPASFNDAQRSATATAGAIAGLTVMRVLNEPTAAALAYGHARELNQIIAVYDFGGGTFDISILRLRDHVYEVLGTAGDTFLGGDDLDERLVDKMVAKFLAENRVDLRTNEVSMMRLRAVAEQTKIELSRRSRAIVRIDEIAYGPNGASLNLQIEVTREEFVRGVSDVIDKTFPVCRDALSLAGLAVDGIDDVILVGGTTKIPYVRDQVSRFFAKAPRSDVNPEDAVAVGAALQATTLDRLLARPRRTSKQVPIVASPSFDATLPGSDLGDTTGSTVTFADELPSVGRLDAATDPERPRRTTAGYSTDRSRAASSTGAPVGSSTAYSMTRAGTRDTLERGTFEERTPPPTSTPLARVTTSRLPSTASAPGDPPHGPPPLPSKSPTSRGQPAQARPPVPTGTLPAIPGAATAALGAAATLPAPPARTTAPGFAGLAEPTAASTLPLSPVRPIAPPTAPTMVAMAAAATAPGMGPAMPSTTAPGFAVPAVPAAHQATILEVTPRGLGIGTVAGYCEELLRRNSRVPAEIVKRFSTSRDRQDTVRIVVCQGESRRLDGNIVIGDLLLQNLPPRPRGETSIEVTFALDASGILHVRARDADTGTEQRAELDLVGGIGEGDVQAARARIQQLRR